MLRAPLRASTAFSRAHDASALVIGAASGSKYCAECLVRLNRSKVGFAKAGMSTVNWADTASSTVM
jgi:hypothetical protein